LLTNETQAANGRVGIAVGLSSGSSFPAGTQEPSHYRLGIDWPVAALLDSPTNASEFQRADCAPRSTFGNGAITVSDWCRPAVTLPVWIR